MRAVLEEQQAFPSGRHDELLAGELANTEQQLAQMVEYQARALSEDDDGDPDGEGDGRAGHGDD